MAPHASHRSPGLSYRPTAHSDARQHASKARTHQGYLDALHKASCDLCGTSLGLLHTEGKMFDIRDPHYTFDLKLLCLPCTEAMEGRIAKGIPAPKEPFDIFRD